MNSSNSSSAISCQKVNVLYATLAEPNQEDAWVQNWAKRIGLVSRPVNLSIERRWVDLLLFGLECELMLRIRVDDYQRWLVFISLWIGLVGVALPGSSWGQTPSFERPPIDYFNTRVDDPVARLAAQLESGETHLDYDQQHGYLTAILEHLNIPISSQVLVFSKTSLQLQRIHPQRPRAVYFNDEVYVGWCQQGDVLELAATDKDQGAIFYSMKQTAGAPAKILRDRGQCLTCHASSRTQNIPGYLVRSVFANEQGHPIGGSSSFTTGYGSPFHERWGGWYVTGQHGDMRHMGNQVYGENDDWDQPDLEKGANRESLDGLVSTRPYLSPHSDLVALLVLEHQSQMHNALAAANYEVREALHQTYEMNPLLGREADFISESAERRIASSVERVVSHLLMYEDARFTSPVSGTSGFTEEFMKRGPRDSQGRSLRELDLRDRLFRYPCSFLVHSEAFDALHDELRGRVIRRMCEILIDPISPKQWENVDADARQVVLEILVSTKPEFADCVAELQREK